MSEVTERQLDDAPAIPAHGETDRLEAHEIVEKYLSLIEPLQAMFGDRTEVVLHDLTNTPSSIVAIANSLTGRVVGEATDLGLVVMAQKERSTQLIGYRTDLGGGVICRSSTIFFYGSGTRPLVGLCVNTDVREVIAAKSTLDAMLGSWSLVEAETAVFHDNVENLSQDVLRRSIKSVGVPVEEMTKKQKVAVVAELQRSGYFLIREAADLAAAALGVTRFTIYNYLNEIR
ncbi:MAG TPA: PAS domain-containing protein [Lacisediminihabitans sp.]|uniref:helix-turn-helix transcriptional regulator n=1 Tax=Lacisediminihabitans sp. TaxID=2787631 RepID=UPI002EDB8652